MQANRIRIVALEEHHTVQRSRSPAQVKRVLTMVPFTVPADYPFLSNARGRAFLDALPVSPAGREDRV
jgi:hypothetical protein